MGAVIGSLLVAVGAVIVTAAEYAAAYATTAAIALGLAEISGGITGGFITYTALGAIYGLNIVETTVGITTLGTVVLTGGLAAAAGGILYAAITAPRVPFDLPQNPFDFLSGNFCTILDLVSYVGTEAGVQCRVDGGRKMRVQTGAQGYSSMSYSSPQVLLPR